ncbi:MAG: GEVED domain-containing protein [Flavobacteriaceae bacterium]
MKTNYYNYLTRKVLRLTIFFLFAVFLQSVDLYAQTVTQTFNSSDSFTVPAGVTSITVQCWGAGGRGSTATNSAGTGRGGGGGGAYASSVLTVVPGTIYTVTVGTGGNNDNINGGNSSFGNNIVMAEGGKGVANNTTSGGVGGQASVSIGDIKYSGGNGTGGNGATSGGGGGGAGSTGNGNNASSSSGGSAKIINGGSGGNGGTATNLIVWIGANGGSGSNYGGGGGGAAKGTLGNNNGGNGASGLVSVTYEGLPEPCSASSTSGTYFINRVSVEGAVTDFNNDGTGYTPGGYNDYSVSHIAEQIPGGGLNIRVILNGGTQYLNAWIDWNQDGDFSDPGENIYSVAIGFVSTYFGVVVPPETSPGLYKIRIRSRQESSTISPCGSYSDGETEDYMLRVVADCPALITDVINGSRCGEGEVELLATGASGVTGFRWYMNEVGGSPLETTATGEWTTPIISENTSFFVTAINGSCESYHRTRIDAIVHSSTNIIVSPEEPLICREGDIVEITVESYQSTEELIHEDFESSFPGSFLVNTITNTAGNGIVWGERTSVFATTTDVWKPAIGSGRQGNKFAFTSSDTGGDTNLDTALELTNSVSTADFTELTLTFRHFYSDYSSTGDYAHVEVSTNGGANWTTVHTFNSDEGIPTNFKTETFDFTDFTGYAQFKIRFRYVAAYTDGWAVDDIRLYGKKNQTVPIEWVNSESMLYLDEEAIIPYNGENVTTVYAKPQGVNLSNPSWVFVVESSLQNGCVIQKDITVTNNSRTWTGISSDWHSTSNWLPLAVPTIDNCVIIPDTSNQPLISQNDAFANSILVKSGAAINVNSDLTVYVKEEINVESNADFIFENNSGLVQIDNTINTGNIIYHRTTAPMNLHDYTYWGAPVSGQITSNLFSNPNNIYKWEPSTQLWVSAFGEVMSTGYGYIMRAPSDFPDSGELKQPLESTFTGIPNNGNISVEVVADPNALSSDPYSDAVMSFLSNPYPSAINIDEFFIDMENNSKIIPTIYLWTHSTDPVLNSEGTAFVYVANDFAAYNLLGGIGTQAAPNDDLGNIPTGKIAAGQGFFIKGSAIGGTVTFKNSYRTDNNGTAYNNSEFYKLNANTETENKHRVWLSLRNENYYKQTLIGYTEGATNNLDIFDGDFYDGGNPISLYSLLDNGKILSIQSRIVPFSDTDEVPLGIKLFVSGNFNIQLDYFDGLFSEDNQNQDIYLRDNLLNIIHDLKESPYEFYSEAGEFNNRFKIVYKESEILSTTTPDQSNNWMVYNIDNHIYLESLGFEMKEVYLYDVLGREIYSSENLNSSKHSIETISTNQMLIVKMVSEDGMIWIKKIQD